MTDLELVSKVRVLVREVASFIKKEARTFKKEHIETKSLNSLVSYVDKTAEAMLVEGLKDLCEAGFIAEEGSGSERSDGTNWLVDPLDGTTNFIHGIPVYAISVALLRENQPVIAVVYEIEKDEEFWAVKGEGAYLGEERISVMQETKLKGALLATGFPYFEFEHLDRYFYLLKDLMKACHGLRRMGSAAIDLAYVACGRFGGFFEYNLYPWDVAAGSLLITEAGGYVTDFQGGNNAIFGREIVAAGNIYPELYTFIAKHFGK